MHRTSFNCEIQLGICRVRSRIPRAAKHWYYVWGRMKCIFWWRIKTWIDGYVRKRMKWIWWQSIKAYELIGIYVGEGMKWIYWQRFKAYELGGWVHMCFEIWGHYAWRMDWMIALEYENENGFAFNSIPAVTWVTSILSGDMHRMLHTIFPNARSVSFWVSDLIIIRTLSCFVHASANWVMSHLVHLQSSTSSVGITFPLHLKQLA